jgi:hypothetical protein
MSPPFQCIRTATHHCPSTQKHKGICLHHQFQLLVHASESFLSDALDPKSGASSAIFDDVSITRHQNGALDTRRNDHSPDRAFSQAHLGTHLGNEIFPEFCCLNESRPWAWHPIEPIFERRYLCLYTFVSLHSRVYNNYNNTTTRETSLLLQAV